MLSCQGPSCCHPQRTANPINVLSKHHFGGYQLQYGRGSENLTAEQPCWVPLTPAPHQANSTPGWQCPPYRGKLAPDGIYLYDSAPRRMSEPQVHSNKLYSFVQGCGSRRDGWGTRKDHLLVFLTNVGLVATEYAGFTKTGKIRHWER